MSGAPNWAAKYPLINGHMYSHASIECDVDGLLFAGITSISYDDPTKPGKLYGTGGVLVGRTPGTNRPTLTMTMYRRDWDILRAQLATGAGSAGNGSFGTKSFGVRVTHHEEAMVSPGPGAQPLTLGVPLGAAVADPAYSQFNRPEDVRRSEAQTVTDTIEGVRVTGVSQASTEGGGATVVVLTCDPWRIRWNSTAGGAGLTNLAEDAANVQAETPQSGQGDGREGPEPVVNVPTRGASTGEFWYADDSGFEGRDYMSNPWDTLTLADMQFPGLCKTKATPQQVIDSQKPNGSDAAAMIVRGYGLCQIEVEVTLWTFSHWAIWQDVVRRLWRYPNKSSPFEKPALKTKSVVAAQSAAPDNRAILKERAAIDRSETNARLEALSIYHPSLAALGITAAVITSIEAPAPGPEPQTFVSRMRLVQYIAPGQREQIQTKRVRGTAKASPTVTPALQSVAAPGQVQSLPYSPAPANSGLETPAMSETGPNLSFEPR